MNHLQSPSVNALDDVLLHRSKRAHVAHAIPGPGAPCLYHSARTQHAGAWWIPWNWTDHPESPVTDHATGLAIWWERRYWLQHWNTHNAGDGHRLARVAAEAGVTGRALGQ